MTETKLPEHFFISECDGSLSDTRNAKWASEPLRVNYRRTHREIKTVADLKATLRAGPFAWPGGYPMYLITSDGGTLSFKTVREEFHNIAYAIKHKQDDGWRVVGCDINYEDHDLYDDHTNEPILAAYPKE